MRYKVKKFMATILVVMLITTLSIAFTGGITTGFAKDIVLNGTSGGLAGVWILIMGGAAEIVNDEYPEIAIRALPGGALVNEPRVGSGECDLGLGYPAFVAAALKGVDPYMVKYPHLKTVMAGFSKSFIHFVAGTEFVKKYNITSIKDIVDQKLPIRFATCTRGSMDEFAARKLWEAYGVTYDDIKDWGGKVYLTGDEDIARKMSDRMIDCFVEHIGAPAGSIIKLSTSRDLTLLPIDEEALNFLYKEWAFGKGYIEAEAYDFLSSDVRTTATFSVMLINDGVSEEVAYKITKAVCENVDRVHAIHRSLQWFDPKDAWKNTGGPLHPGAERYFKEKGYME